MHGLRSYTF